MPAKKTPWWQQRELMYCDYCETDTPHFLTMGLLLPCCTQCMSLNTKAIFGYPVERKVESIAVENALIEHRVMKEKGH